MNCLNCDTPFVGRLSKKFCTQSCAAIYNNGLRSKTKGSCPQCGTKVTGQKFCSRRCVFKFTIAIIESKLANGERNLSSRTVKRFLIHKNGEKCMECGWDKRHPITRNVPIELEHMDGDSTNNSLGNIKLLCPNCHSLTTTYKALNTGKGRHKRRLRYKQGKSF